MKKIWLILLVCCVLFCGCEEEKEREPLLAICWQTTIRNEIYADVVTARCGTEKRVAEVKEAIEKEIAAFPCRTNEEVTACAWALCDVLIEYDCIPPSWVPIEASHYLNGIWSVGFAPAEDRELLRENYEEWFDQLDISILSYDAMRYLTFECTQAEVILQTENLPLQSCDISWIDAAPNTLRYERNGQPVEIPLEASTYFADARVQEAVLAAEPTLPLDQNAAIAEYAAMLRKSLKRYGYLEDAEAECRVYCFENGVLVFYFDCTAGKTVTAFVLVKDGHMLHIK